MSKCVVLLLLLTSCVIDIPKEELYDPLVYVYDTIEYEVDNGADYCQSPEETLSRGIGDCEDFAILFMYLCYKDYGIKPKLVVLDVGENLHSVAFYNGVYYDATIKTVYTEPLSTDKVRLTVSYDIAMLYATGFYTKGELNANR